MGKVIVNAEVQAQVRATNSAIDPRIQDLDRMSEAVSRYTDDTSLQGQAYNASKEYMQFFYLPLYQGMRNANDALKGANSEVAAAGNEHLSGHHRIDVNRMEKWRDRRRSSRSSHVAERQSVEANIAQDPLVRNMQLHRLQGLIDQADSDIRFATEALDSAAAFEAAIANTHQVANEMFAQVAIALSQINSNASTGSFTVPSTYPNWKTELIRLQDQRIQSTLDAIMDADGNYNWKTIESWLKQDAANLTDAQIMALSTLLGHFVNTEQLENIERFVNAMVRPVMQDTLFSFQLGSSNMIDVTADMLGNPHFWTFCSRLVERMANMLDDKMLELAVEEYEHADTRERNNSMRERHSLLEAFGLLRMLGTDSSLNSSPYTQLDGRDGFVIMGGKDSANIRITKSTESGLGRFAINFSTMPFSRSTLEEKFVARTASHNMMGSSPAISLKPLSRTVTIRQAISPGSNIRQAGDIQTSAQYQDFILGRERKITGKNPNYAGALVTDGLISAISFVPVIGGAVSAGAGVGSTASGTWRAHKRETELIDTLDSGMGTVDELTTLRPDAVFIIDDRQNIEVVTAPSVETIKLSRQR